MHFKFTTYAFQCGGFNLNFGLLIEAPNMPAYTAFNVHSLLSSLIKK